MAMKKVVEVQDTGVMVEYWRVHFFAVDWDSNRGRIGLIGYVNRAARDAGKNPVRGADMSMSLSNIDVSTIGAIPMADVSDGKDIKDIDLKKSYLFLRSQQVSNPEYDASKPTDPDTNPEFIPGPFAEDDVTDV